LTPYHRTDVVLTSSSLPDPSQHSLGYKMPNFLSFPAAPSLTCFLRRTFLCSFSFSRLIFPTPLFPPAALPPASLVRRWDSWLVPVVRFRDLILPPETCLLTAYFDRFFLQEAPHTLLTPRCFKSTHLLTQYSSYVTSFFTCIIAKAPDLFLTPAPSDA